MTWTESETASEHATDTVPAGDGTGLWARRSGRGEPLVLCHGGPGLWDMFEEVAALLGDLASVVRWDQRGCGRSDPSDGPWTSERAVADLDAVRGHFGLERMVLLGHSWGAQLALSYALAHPERVRALVYVSGTGIGPDADWHDAYRDNLHARLAESPELHARWSELTARRPTLSEAEARENAVLQWSAEFPERGRALEHAGRMADPWFSINHRSNQAFNAERKRTWGTPDLYDRCRVLDLPVVIIDGMADIRPRTAVDSLERALPCVRRVILPGAGHLPWVDDPTGFRQAVATVL
ncbi:alpha/beta fold hydrolase [Streptomyces sp. NBC_00459]|uniref:alpha/beta fold hydrolase n=1 Tax=Streptomyces sp. NBC_00459 TaxID=2975749 RepID=UPI002E16DAE5